MVKAKKTTLGRNALRDFLETDITHLAVGDGTTDPTEGDTSLENELEEKAATATVLSDGRVQHEITLGLTEGNGETLSEVGTKDGAGGDLQDRLVFSGIEKEGDFELRFVVINEPKNP